MIIMNSSENKGYLYLTPEVKVLHLVVEQCIASSGLLNDMEDNNIFDEDFI